MAKKTGKRYTEEQIIRILSELEKGTPIDDLCRKYNVAQSTVYNWRKKYGGMTVEELRRLKRLEKENAQLKRLVADQALDIVMLKDMLGKDWSAPE